MTQNKLWLKSCWGQGRAPTITAWQLSPIGELDPLLNLSSLNLKMEVAGLVDLSKPLAREQLEEAEDETREEPKRLRKKWTWDDPIYTLQSSYAAYAGKPEVKWQRSEFEENGFCAVEPESEQKKAFTEMVFEPLPVPERIGITCANYQEADLIRFPPGQDRTRRDVVASTPDPSEAAPSLGARVSTVQPSLTAI